MPATSFTYGTQAQPVAVTIASGQSVSDVLTLGGSSVVGITMPAAWTAADLTFLVSDAAGGTFVPLYSTAGEVAVPSAQIATAASRAFYLDPAILLPFPYVQVRSGTAAAAVAQGAARTITLWVRPI